ncbi:MAG TPA: hypothetical protein VLM11_19535 [Streptosporangiaceae bacterium]|nr:hypothetical protein [Streptosporangiaceae bacterium]
MADDIALTALGFAAVLSGAGKGVGLLSQLLKVPPQQRPRLPVKVAHELVLQAADDLSGTTVRSMAIIGGVELPDTPVHGMRAPSDQSGSLGLINGQGDALRRESETPGQVRADWPGSCASCRRIRNTGVGSCSGASQASTARSMARWVRERRCPAGGVAYRAVGRAGLGPRAITNAGRGESRHFIVELLADNATEDPQPTEHNGRGTTELLTTS